jgi:ABC-2 type transport system ATP-binding protein
MNEVILELQAVGLRYGHKFVVQDAHLSVRRGEWIALVGPNASGKTTLLRSAAGFLAPASGLVRFNGKSLYAANSPAADVPGFAVSPQELPEFLTLRQCLQIHADAHGLAGIPDGCWQLCRELALEKHANELIRHLSLGTRQKLAVVLALQAPTALLLIDEVFNGLDIRSAMSLKKHLRTLVTQTGLAILMATHSLDVVKEYCDGMVLIDAGRLVATWDAGRLRSTGAVADLERALAAELDQVER